MCCDSFLFPSNVTAEWSVHVRRPSSRPNGWEVVQSVGLQTLDLAILVRVQASQPIMRPNLPVKAVLFCNQPLIGAASKANSQAACHRRAVPAGHRSQTQRSLAYATSCRNPYYRGAWRCERRLWRPLRLFPDSTNAPASTLRLPQQSADDKLRNLWQCEHLQL